MLVTSALMLVNLQFATLSIVLTVPWMSLEPQKDSNKQMYWALLLLMSHPLVLFFTLFGFYEAGFSWLLGMMSSSYNWSSPLWHFMTVLWLPLQIIGIFKVVKNQS